MMHKKSRDTLWEEQVRGKLLTKEAGNETCKHNLPNRLHQHKRYIMTTQRNWMNNPDLTAGEISLIKWQMGFHGDFKKALWTAIGRADEGNLYRLAHGFPDEVEAYKRYTRESGYWKDVLNRAGLEQN